MLQDLLTSSFGSHYKCTNSSTPKDGMSLDSVSGTMFKATRYFVLLPKYVSARDTGTRAEQRELSGGVVSRSTHPFTGSGRSTDDGWVGRKSDWSRVEVSPLCDICLRPLFIFVHNSKATRPLLLRYTLKKRGARDDFQKKEQWL
ncbi:hypothetical protein J6590_078582 [Homalodisca vitripennis]|nr:hypothetical protein J6590_078582 [Homalodisca vitripennis]